MDIYEEARRELDRNIMGTASIRHYSAVYPRSRVGLVRGLTEIALEFAGTPPWPHFDKGCWSVTEVQQR